MLAPRSFHILAALLLTLTVAVPGPVLAQDMPPPSPFAGFETIYLENGLKVLFKHLSGHPDVSVSLIVPVGRDHDPPGREELAHFLEHMLFSDHLGRTEEEIKREVESRGGVRNGLTYSDKTAYYVQIGKEHGLFAIEWLYKVVSLHSFDAEVVERQRTPVALEVGARRRQLGDWIFALYVNPPFLRLPGFWEREFGVTTRASRDYYPHRSLNLINSKSLHEFYEAYYVPSLMTMAVIGDLDQTAVMTTLNRTFATLPERRPPEFQPELQDPGRRRQMIFWAPRSNVLYENLFKFYDLSAEEDLQLEFVRRLLSKRLNERLRFGDQKATYGIGVDVARRGRAAILIIRGGLKQDEFESARRIIEEELEALRTGSLRESDFIEDRATLSHQLAVQNTSPEDLEFWIRNVFYAPTRHRDIPDMVAVFDSMTLASVQAFTREHLVPERQILSIFYPLPLSQGVLVALVIVLIALSVRSVKGMLVRPVDMTRIHYVARFRRSTGFRIISTVAFTVTTAIGLRVVVHLYNLVANSFVVSVESTIVQGVVYAAMGASIVVLLVLTFATIPRKLLFFDNQLLIKYQAYRSTALKAHDIAEVSLCRFSSVWLSRRLWRCRVLAFGILAPGIYLRQRNGRSYFFQVRQPDDVLRLVRQFISDSAN